MPNLKTLLTILLHAAVLWAVPAIAQGTPIKVAYVPATVRGEYQPLDTASVNALLLECMKSEAPDLEFIPLQVDIHSTDPQGQIDAAIQTARDNGAELIAWGSVSFRRSAQTSRGDIFYRGRLKLWVTAVADIQVASVPQERRILSQPTMATSSEQTNAFTEDGDPTTEKRLAEKSLRETARSIVQLVRQRRATGTWAY